MKDEDLLLKMELLKMKEEKQLKMKEEKQLEMKEEKIV